LITASVTENSLTNNGFNFRHCQREMCFEIVANQETKRVNKHFYIQSISQALRFGYLGAKAFRDHCATLFSGDRRSATSRRALLATESGVQYIIHHCEV